MTISLKDRLTQITGSSTSDDPLAPKKPIVVVVDDDEHVLAALGTVLRRHYDVRCFTDPVQGAQEAGKLEVSVAILDIMMPVHDGFWVFEQIRQRNPHIPIIFNSAYQDLRDASAMRAVKPYMCLPKSGNVKDFLAAVASAIASGGHSPHP